MALLDRFRGPAPAPPSQVEPRPAITIHSVTDTSLPQVEPDSPITVHVIEDTNTFEGHDGEIIWGGGYAPVDEDGLFLYEADHETSDPRAFYCKIAGAQHRPKALADKRRFAVGSRIVLRPEPDNPYDPNAVGIWDASGEVQVGYVPATLSAEVAALMRSGKTLGGQVIREFRLGSSRGKRLALHVILSPLGPGRYVFHDESE